MAGGPSRGLSSVSKAAAVPARPHSPRRRLQVAPMAGGEGQEPRTALITGGTRGIGLAVAECLARDGYTQLVLAYNSDAEGASAAKARLEEEYGAAVECVAGDLSTKESWDALFERVAQRFDNRLHAFVHNAGCYIGRTSVSDAQPRMKPAEEGQRPQVEDADAEFLYYTSIYALGFKRGLQRALQCQGLSRVVAISAQGCNATQGPSLGYEFPGQGKAAMEHLVRYNALALAKQGITCNTVVPGFTKTGAWDKLGAPTDLLEAMVAKSPAGRWGSPQEVGEAVAFLCSPAASFVTGSCLFADGGKHLVS